MRLSLGPSFGLHPWPNSWLSRFLRALSPESPPSPALAIDPSFRRVMVYLFVGSRGGQNRVKIVQTLKSEPSNSNQLSDRLGLDYKTVQHHLKVLEQNGVIVSNAKGSYGAMFFLTPYFEKYFESVKTMWERFGQS